MNMKQGLLMHRMLHTFENLSIQFQKRGASKSVADRESIYTVFRLEGWPEEEATKFADSHFPKESQ